MVEQRGVGLMSLFAVGAALNRFSVTVVCLSPNPAACGPLVHALEVTHVRVVDLAPDMSIRQLSCHLGHYRLLSLGISTSAHLWALVCTISRAPSTSAE